MKKLLIVLAALLLCLTCAAAEETLYPAMGENGLYGYINAGAEWVIAPQFDWAGSFRGDYAPFAAYPKGSDVDSPWDADCMGVIDRQGNWVLEPEYCLVGGQSGDSFGGEDTGIWLVYRDADMALDEEGFLLTKEGFFDIPTGTFSGLKWGAVWHWCSDSRLIPVEDPETGLSGYADRSTGEMVIPCLYYSVDPANFNDGVATVALSDEDGYETSPWHLINERGETIPLPEGWQSAYANQFSCGRIAVVNPDGLWGYADGTGSIVIPAQFAEAYEFCDGFARVEFAEDDMGYIDTDGNVLARGFAHASDFRNGYAEVWLSGTNGADKVTGWINTAGEVVPFMDSDRFFPISPDRMWMRTEARYGAPWHLLDGEGNILTAEPVYLPEMEPIAFESGLQAVGNAEHKWGYIVLDGQEALPFIYNYAEAFDGELARVRLGDRVGYIDRAGNEVYMWDDPIE